MEFHDLKVSLGGQPGTISMSWSLEPPEGEAGNSGGVAPLTDLSEETDITPEEWFTPPPTPSPATRFTAELTRVGDIARVVGYSVCDPRGVPDNARVLPSEVTLIMALRRAGPPALAYLQWLMGAEVHVPGPLDVALSQVAGPLDRMAKEVTRRPKLRPELVEEARQMLDQGEKTKKIVGTLMTHDVSESTAYRAIRRARRPERYA